MGRAGWMAVAAAVLVGALAILVFANGNAVRKTLYAQAMPGDYFSHFLRIKPSLYQVAGPVYAFERGFTRSLVVRTSEGIAVIDTFNDEHARAMKSAIEQTFPGVPIRWVIFSHNHLDHIRGSQVLGASEVIGHAEINQLVADWPDIGAGIAQVTRAIEKDQTLRLGDVEIDALYMPYSHSHTLYAFHIRSAGVVFAPDMMFVKTLPPFDFPDFYYPGYVRALDRLIALNAGHYVPSHTDRGTRDDLVAFRNMTVDFQSAVKSELLARGLEGATDGKIMREVLSAAYDKLEPKYGDWHGFQAMFVPKFGRHFGGTYLGY
jgi:glyoxylase-like metal-dependent hydrolase (beta-lactamase superfamily II)